MKLSGLSWTFPLLVLITVAACGSNTATNQSEDLATQSNNASTAGLNQPLIYSGIDVSKYQGDIDWSKVAASGKHFAIAKATGGLTVNDAKFTQNWTGIKAAGMTRGAYHFYYPKDDAKKQAEHFISTVKLQAGDLAPVLDIETSQDQDPAGLHAGILEWLKIIESHYGIKPIIYSNYSFLKSELPTGFCDYPLWLADYNPQAPTGVACWEHWDILQYSQNGTVAGINGKVDLDKYRGSAEGWQKLLLSKSTANIK